MADTAWELFHRLTLAEADHYFEIRRRQGFNVIQAVVLPEIDGLHTPNINGRIPLAGDDPTRPNELYFRDLDAVIRLAASKGLYVGLVPTWGDKINGEMWGVGPVIFNSENAKVYGRFLGQRYRDDTNILWILGGDRTAEGYEALWASMADGITEGLGHRPLFTFHPRGGMSSSAWLHNAEWLSFNMMQSGHVLLDTPNWEMITSDYERNPVKPTLDGEPNYEDHPIDPYLRKWRPEHGRYTDYDVRKQAYRAIFSGACGHTYGHHSIWQFWTLQREPIHFPMPTWDEAILRPGAEQMFHLKNLILSRPYLSRIPAQEMIPDILPTPPVGELEADRFNPLRASLPRATCCADGSFGMVYFPKADQTLRVNLNSLKGLVRACWFDPRNGSSHPAGIYPNELVSFTSPIAGPDWVLVLDSDKMDFAPPGKSS